MKVYFLLEDKGIKSLDLSKPEIGNPGVGGTQFMIVQLAAELAKKDDIDVSILHYRNQKLPINVNSVLIQESVFETLKICEPDIFIFHPNKNEDWYKSLNSLNIKSIAWLHNYISYYDANVLAKCSNIKAVVFVGKQQYDRYIDHSIIYKSLYIFNFIPEIGISRSFNYQPWVTFVGSLTSPKGFHWVPQCWKDIMATVPQAQLHVIGSGNLYSRDQANGKYGIASEKYESLIMPGLTDENGNILESVVFHGNLGAEKYNILQHTAVGIINPTGETETFGLGAVEMQQLGIPVVTRKKYGLLDTVQNHNTGILINSTDELKKAIICLLVDEKKNRVFGLNAKNFVKKKFDKNVIIEQWCNLLYAVVSDDVFRPAIHLPTDYLTIDMKWLRVIIAITKKVPFLKWVPSLGEICEKVRNIM